MCIARGLAMIVMSASVPLILCADDDARLKKMHELWKARQEAARVVSIKWSDTLIEQVDKEQDKKALAVDELTASLLIARGNLMRYDLAPKDPLLGARNGGRGASISTFDGVRSRIFTAAVGPGDYPRGRLQGDEVWDDLHTFNFLAVLLHYRPLFQAYPDLSIDRLRVTATDATIRGRVCTVIETKPVNNSTEVLWVDLEHDGIILRHQGKLQGRITSELNIEYEPDEQGRWNLKSWSGEFSSGTYDMAAEVTDLQFDSPVEISTFELAFPAGTMVFDRNLGKRWLQLPSGRKRVITPEESMKGFDYQSLLNSPDDDLPAEKSP
jgi:hypothetical protein